MIFDCPKEYFFNFLQLTVYRLGEDGKFHTTIFQLQPALFNSEESKCQKHWTVRLPLSKIGVSEPAMYEASLKAELCEEYEEEDFLDGELEANMVCSDVNHAYYYMIDSILSMGDRCANLSDDAIRNYLILYAHQAALSQHDIETAQTYFKLILQKFDHCGNGPRPRVTPWKSPCNCGRR